MKLRDALVDAHVVYILINDEYAYHRILWYDMAEQTLCLEDDEGDEYRTTVSGLASHDIKVLRLVEVDIDE